MIDFVRSTAQSQGAGCCRLHYPTLAVTQCHRRSAASDEQRELSCWCECGYSLIVGSFVCKGVMKRLPMPSAPCLKRSQELTKSLRRNKSCCQFELLSLLMVGSWPSTGPHPFAENHIVTVVTRVSPHLFLNDALEEEALAGSRLCGAAMTVLRCATDPCGIGLTKSGAFNRRFVTWAVGRVPVAALHGCRPCRGQQSSQRGGCSPTQLPSRAAVRREAHTPCQTSPAPHQNRP